MCKFILISFVFVSSFCFAAEIPYRIATQTQVNQGTNATAAVTPKTLAGWSGAGTSANTVTNNGVLTSSLVKGDGNRGVVNVSVGATPIDGDGTATTFLQVNALAPGNVITQLTSFRYTNNIGITSSNVDLTGTTLRGPTTNSAIAASSLMGTDANKVGTNIVLPSSWSITGGVLTPALLTNVVKFKINGGSSTVITPTYMDWTFIPYNCTIDHVTMLASPSGSAVVEVMTCTTNVFDGGVTHPVAADKITASAPPTLTTAYVSQDGTLTGWKLGLTNHQVFACQVTSATTVTNLEVSFHVTRAQ